MTLVVDMISMLAQDVVWPDSLVSILQRPKTRWTTGDLGGMHVFGSVL